MAIKRLRGLALLQHTNCRSYYFNTVADGPTNCWNDVDLPEPFLSGDSRQVSPGLARPPLFAVILASDAHEAASRVRGEPTLVGEGGELASSHEA
jgi:hypothetical protein